MGMKMGRKLDLLAAWFTGVSLAKAFELEEVSNWNLNPTFSNTSAIRFPDVALEQLPFDTERLALEITDTSVPFVTILLL